MIDVGVFLFFSLKYLFPFIFYLSGGKAYQLALVDLSSDEQNLAELHPACINSVSRS